MSDLPSTLQRIADAPDLSSLDAERVSALGKNGWVTALLKTLGGMSPEERQSQGPAIQGQRAEVAAAIEARKAFVLRTHASPVQIRAMQQVGAPLRVIAPGRVYRSDSDATHTPMFHQVEGLVIDRNITMGHLKWTLETFLKAFFERDDIAIRMRPSYFPFTEPSAEVDVGWSMEKGRRVVGGQEGWMEVLGSGMVHPRVIAAAGLDPDEWQGFAFGTGIDRLAMLKYGMNDLRQFFDGDIRWLKHYGFSALAIPTLSAGVGA